MEPGAYALVLVVRRPQGPAANSVTIEVGDTNEIYRSTQQAIDEAVEACLGSENAAAGK